MFSVLKCWQSDVSDMKLWKSLVHGDKSCIFNYHETLKLQTVQTIFLNFSICYCKNFSTIYY